MTENGQMADYIMQLNAKVAALESEVHHLSRVVESQDGKLDTIVATLERHKTIVAMFSGAAGIIGGLAVHLWEKVGAFK